MYTDIPGKKKEGLCSLEIIHTFELVLIATCPITLTA